jgi:hypothetical protein
MTTPDRTPLRARKGGNCSDHPPYSPDLAPSNFHLFGALKDAIRERRFAEDDELRHNVREEHRRISKYFVATVMQRLRQTWKSLFIMKENL